MSFGADLSAFSDRTNAKMNEVVRQYVMVLSYKIVKRSPVDTGRFRGNWQYRVGSPARGNLNRLDKEGVKALSQIVSEIPVQAAGLVHYLSNNLPYGPRLEFEGWSKQAPAGMVGISVKEFPQDIAKLTKEVA